MVLITPPRIAVGADVLCCRAVARFTGDPELGDAGIHLLEVGQAGLCSTRRTQPRLAAGCVAPDAVRVPAPLSDRLFHVWRQEEHGVDRNPALLFDAVDHGEER